MERNNFKVFISKILLLMFVFVHFSLNGFSQVKKLYLNSSGKIVNEAKKAAFYILSDKTNDTAYFIRKYDIDNDILFKGTFRDSVMKTPNGKFYFYAKSKLISLTGSSENNTGSFIVLAGSFLNGRRDGTWIEYIDSKTKSQLYTFKNDELNGRYEEYNLNSGSVSLAGNFENNIMEGEWNGYEKDSLKATYTDLYHHGKLVKSIYHSWMAKPSPALDKYIVTALDPFTDFLKDQGIIVDLSVTADGRVDQIVGTNKPVDSNVLEQLKSAFLKAPNFEPALLYDRPVGQIYHYNFKFIFDRIKNGQPGPFESASHTGNTSGFPDYFGRRLKGFGIGKPIQ